MNQTGWVEADDEYQEFYKFCLGPDAPKFFDQDKFPYELSLGLGPDGMSLLPFRQGGTSAGILVTKAYEDMFKRLMSLRGRDAGNNVGAGITGQPGVGAFI